MRYKVVFFFITFAVYSIELMAQKAKLDIQAIENWTTIGIKQISADGRYILYTYGSGTSMKLVVQEGYGKWKLEIDGVTQASFTTNGRFVVFGNSKDSVGILATESKYIEYLSAVGSYKLPDDGTIEWFGYIKKGTKDLYVRNLDSKSESRYADVVSYQFAPDGESLLVEREIKDSSKISYAIQLLQYKDSEPFPLWQGDSKIIGIGMSRVYQQIAFTAEENDGATKRIKLFYFKPGLKKAISILQNVWGDSNQAFSLVNQHGNPQFNKDGGTIFFPVKKIASNAELNSLESHEVNLKIWNTQDAKLKVQKKKIERNYTAALNLLTNRVTVIDQHNEVVLGQLRDTHHGLVLMRSKDADDYEYSWNSSSKTNIFLVDTGSGKRVTVKKSLIPIDLMNIKVSPGGQFVVYYDMEQRDYFSFNISKDTTVNISRRIGFPLYDEEDDQPGAARVIAAPRWIQRDESLLIQDYFDVWRIDPNGKVKPVCLTDSFGRKNRILLRMIEAGESSPDGIDPKEDVLLAALDKGTKETGFYKTNVSLAKKPHLLTMGRYIYYYPKSSYNVSSSLPIKAKDKDVFVIERMSPQESPNIFVSKDLKSFKQISFIHPEKMYNWMTSELVKWKIDSNQVGEGILYKPENFNPNKSYPVVFLVYEKGADELFNFKAPKLSDGELNVPYFVSRDYLVFTPSIDYKVGEPGPSASNSILSAAHYLSQNPWVDSSRLGLQGASFGGYEVNYVITQSNIFAAAAESAGPVDFVSGYNSMRNNGGSYHYIYETHQSRIGATLWEKRELFIKNSPIFYANKITTPLLIMHNSGDDQVPFQQGLELFSAMRRLNKQAWMLQYENEGHGIGGIKAQQDYTTRLLQFFDHYLKNEKAPEWMGKPRAH